MKKYLHPLRERLIWIPVFFSSTFFIYVIMVILQRPLHPDFSIEYIIRLDGIKILGLQLLLALILVGCYKYNIWLGKHIVQVGDHHFGEIDKVIWKRTWLGWCEWKCRFVVKDKDQEYFSPYYKYDILNYLDDTSCEFYTWRNHCYIKNFKTIEREMPKEQKKIGDSGGGIWLFCIKEYNSPPDFPILMDVVDEKAYGYKPSKWFTNRTEVFWLLMFYALIIFSRGIIFYSPLDTDSDGDRAWDSEEIYYLKSDPLKYDSTFQYSQKTESEKYQVSIDVTGPYTNYMFFYLHCDKPIMEEDKLSGYVDKPFVCERLPGTYDSAVLTVTFDESLLDIPGFDPGLCTINSEWWDYSWMPVSWDGHSNYFTVDLDPEIYRAHYLKCILFNKNEWHSWYYQYAPIQESDQ